MKDFALSYDKNMSFINNITVSPNIKIIVLYTHFMKNSKNTWNFSPHLHSFNELHINLCGKCEMQQESKNISLFENEYILVPANTEHCFKVCSDDFFRFSIAFDIIYEENRMLVPKLSVLKMNERCVGYIENILNEYEENKPGCKNVTDALFSCLIIEILRMTDIFRSTNSMRYINSDFCDALQFIDNGISHKITAADVADRVFLSTRHLNRIFSANLNMTVTQYIKHKKVSIIKEYLEKTNLNANEIAHLTGFDSDISFCKFFKRETGLPPMEYRLSVTRK